jgi:hypothetical protein
VKGVIGVLFDGNSIVKELLVYHLITILYSILKF